MAAVGMCFIGVFTLGETTLSAIQLLWINLIEDSLGALALVNNDYLFFMIKTIIKILKKKYLILV